MASLLEVIANAIAHGWKVEKEDCLFGDVNGCWIYYAPDGSYRSFHMSSGAKLVDAWEVVIRANMNLAVKLSDKVQFICVSEDILERLQESGILGVSDFYTVEESEER